jgi:hypothetical protein
VTLSDRIAKLEQAARLARPIGTSVLIVNDPEDEAVLAPYRRVLDQNKTCEIGPMSPDNYETYQAAARAALAGAERRAVTQLSAWPSA